MGYALESDCLELDVRGAIDGIADATPFVTSDIEKLDLTMVKLKLQDAEEGLGWSPQECDAAEIDYKRFMALKRAYPSVDIVPHKAIDAFWHQHILDTRRYGNDVLALFGYFLHHDPYFGVNGDEDYRNLCDAFEETRRLYKVHFGTEYGEVTGAKRCRAPKCRTQCKPVKCK